MNLHSLRRYWPVLVLLLAPLIPLFRAIFLGQAIGPFDQIHQMAPWNGPKPAQPWDVLQADGVLQFFVWRDLVFDAWSKGQLPFWNPYQLAGTPLLGNSQSGALYPPHVILGLLRVPTGFAMSLLAWFHLFWAGLGSYKLCRALGSNKVGGVVAGLGFALSTFMIAWTGLPSVIETIAWLPWILALTLMLFDQERTTPKYVVGLGLCVGMMILAGHLQFVAYGMIGVVLFVVWLLATHKRKLGVLPVALGVILGFCIAAPQLLAVLSYSQFSHRKNTPTEKGYSSYVAGAIEPYELVKILAPTIQGNPRELYDAKLPVSTYYPALLKPGANFAESALGLGCFTVFLLALLPLVAKLRDPIWGIIAIGGVGLLLALGTPLNQLLYYDFPGWSSTGSPGRAICLFVLAGSIGAGLAASRLEGLLETLKAKRHSAVGLGVGLVIVIGALWLTKDGYELRRGLSAADFDPLRSQAESSALPGLMGVALLSLLAIGLALKESSKRAAAALICVPVLSSVAFFGTSLIQTGNPADLHVGNQTGMQRIAAINGAWDMFLASRALLPPNLAALNRIHSLDGYDSLIHRDTVAMLRDVDGGNDPAPAINGNMMLISPQADMKKLADAGVTQVWSLDPVAALPPVTAQSGVYKYTLPGPGRASTPGGPAEILEETPTKIRLSAKGPGKLVLRDRNMPGWHPKVDGQHVAMGGTTWMEVDLGPGDHQVEFNYVPPGFMPGLYLAALALLIVLAATLAPLGERVGKRSEPG